MRFIFFYQRMLHIACKAVLPALVAHAAVRERTATQTPAVGKQNGRMAAPHAGVRLPHQLPPGGFIPYADKLRPLG